MLRIFVVGGPILWLLFAISVVVLAIMLERIVFFVRNEKGVAKDFNIKINQLILENKIDEAIELCDSEKSYISSSVKKFLKRANIGRAVRDYQSIIKEITLEEISPLEKHLSCLSSIINIAPMLGLLGTVTGMIKAFINISKLGTGDASVVADGIAEALLTTAAGLIIAIPAIVIYNYLNRRIENVENEIDKITVNIINVFRRNYE